jgi:hypothetical protein
MTITVIENFWSHGGGKDMTREMGNPTGEEIGVPAS